MNEHNAKIYKDNQGRYVVKVEEYFLEDEPTLIANYKGDRYMGPEGFIYWVVEDPKMVRTLGEPRLG